MRIFNDLISALLLQKDETRSASSSARGFVPGQEFEGTVLGKDGLLDLIDMGGRIVRARSQAPLPRGGRIRVMVLQSGNPVKVRLLAHQAQPSDDSGRKSYLALKASGLKTSQAVRLVLGSSAGNTVRGFAGSTGSSGLVGLRQILSGLSVDENTSVERIRALVAALASPKDSSGTGLLRDLITQTLQALSREEPGTGKAASMLSGSRTDGWKSRATDIDVEIPWREGKARTGPGAGKENSPKQGGKTGSSGRARPGGTDFKALSRHGLRDKPSPTASSRMEAQDKDVPLQDKGHASKVSLPGGKMPSGKSAENGFLPTRSSGNPSSVPGSNASTGIREPRINSMPSEGATGRTAPGMENQDNQDDVHFFPLKEVDRPLKVVGSPGENPAPVRDRQMPLSDRPAQGQRFKTRAGAQSRQLAPEDPGQAERKPDMPEQRPAAVPPSDRESVERTPKAPPGPASEKTEPGARPQGRAESVDPREFSHEPASRASGMLHSLKTISSHLEAVQQYHPPLIPQDAPFLLIPLWFGRGEGSGHWMWWQEKQGGNKDNPDRSEHLFFDLDLKSLGPVKIHILSGRPGLSITLWARESVLRHFRTRLDALLESLNGLGIRMETMDVFPLEAMDPDAEDFSSRKGRTDSKGGFHKVT